MEARKLKTCTSKPVESQQLLLSALERAFKYDKVLAISKDIPEFTTAMEINLALAKKLTEVSQIKGLMNKELLEKLVLCTQDRTPKPDVYALLNEVYQNKEIMLEISESTESVTAAAANHSLLKAIVKDAVEVKDEINKDLWTLLEDCSELPVPQVAGSSLKSNDFHLEEEELCSEKNQWSLISAEISDAGAESVLDTKAVLSTLKESRQCMQNISNEVASLREIVQSLVNLVKLPEEMKDGACIASPTNTTIQEKVSTEVEILKQPWKSLYKKFLKYISMLQNILIIGLVTALIKHFMENFRGPENERNFGLFVFFTTVILNILLLFKKLL